MRAKDVPLHGSVRWSGRLTRRRLGLVVMVGLAAPLVVRPSRAESVTAPVGLQAELLAKVAEDARNFVARAGERGRWAGFRRLRACRTTR